MVFKEASLTDCGNGGALLLGCGGNNPTSGRLLRDISCDGVGKLLGAVVPPSSARKRATIHTCAVSPAYGSTTSQLNSPGQDQHLRPSSRDRCWRSRSSSLSISFRVGISASVHWHICESAGVKGKSACGL